MLCWKWCCNLIHHDDVIKWKQFPRYWPFVRGIHRSPVNSPHKGQCRGALMFSLICARRNGWVNNREAGDLRRHPAHCDVIVMIARLFHQAILFTVSFVFRYILPRCPLLTYINPLSPGVWDFHFRFVIRKCFVDITIMSNSSNVA